MRRAYPWHAVAPDVSPARTTSSAAIATGAAAVLATAPTRRPSSCAQARRAGGGRGAGDARRARRHRRRLLRARVPARRDPGDDRACRGTEVDAWLLAVPAGAIDALDATEPNYVRAAHPPAQAPTCRSTARCAWTASRSRSPRSPRADARCRALTEAELLEQVRLRLASNETPDASCWRTSPTSASAPRGPRRCGGAVGRRRRLAWVTLPTGNPERDARDHSHPAPDPRPCAATSKRRPGSSSPAVTRPVRAVRRRDPGVPLLRPAQIAGLEDTWQRIEHGGDPLWLFLALRSRSAPSPAT